MRVNWRKARSMVAIVVMLYPHTLLNANTPAQNESGLGQTQRTVSALLVSLDHISARMARTKERERFWQDIKKRARRHSTRRPGGV
jgi:hypothetical protein